MPAFTAAFGAARDFQFTIRPGVDRIQTPTQTFDTTLRGPGPNTGERSTFTWSGTITVLPA